MREFVNFPGHQKRLGIEGACSDHEETVLTKGGVRSSEADKAYVYSLHKMN